MYCNLVVKLRLWSMKKIRHVFPHDINNTYPLVFNSFPGFIHYSLHIFYWHYLRYNELWSRHFWSTSLAPSYRTSLAKQISNRPWLFKGWIMLSNIQITIHWIALSKAALNHWIPSSCQMHTWVDGLCNVILTVNILKVIKIIQLMISQSINNFSILGVPY